MKKNLALGKDRLYSKGLLEKEAKGLLQEWERGCWNRKKAQMSSVLQGLFLSREEKRTERTGCGKWDEWMPVAGGLTL